MHLDLCRVRDLNFRAFVTQTEVLNHKDLYSSL